MFGVTIKQAKESSDTEPSLRRLANEFNMKTLTVNENEIKIQMEFANPLDVTPYD